ncbi:MAG: cytochrome c3 family protein, partial [Pseudomonadota bacterium]
MWSIWLAAALGLSVWLGTQLFVQSEKPDFLIGETSHAHHQIEMQCTACHLEPFNATNVLQEACTGCHSEELRIAQDSHPRSKFTDPRNADTLAKLDARYCVTCHREHNEDITQALAVTLPEDFCFHCHTDIATDRPSHTGMEFNTCASAGCHNYHDNRSLYEDFLVENAAGPWLKPEGRQPDRDIVAYMEKLGIRAQDRPLE